MCELWRFAAAAVVAVVAAATGATAAAALLVCCCCWLLVSAQITTKFSAAQGKNQLLNDRNQAQELVTTPNTLLKQGNSGSVTATFRDNPTHDMQGTLTKNMQSWPTKDNPTRSSKRSHQVPTNLER